MLATSQNSIGAKLSSASGSTRAAMRVERVPALVQQDVHVALQPGRVHEDERLARLGEQRLIPAGLLALAAGEVEVVAARSDSKSSASCGDMRAKICFVPSIEPVDLVLAERPQRRAALAGRRACPTGGAFPARGRACAGGRDRGRAGRRSRRSRRRSAGSRPACSRIARTSSSSSRGSRAGRRCAAIVSRSGSIRSNCDSIVSRSRSRRSAVSRHASSRVARSGSSWKRAELLQRVLDAAERDGHRAAGLLVIVDDLRRLGLKRDVLVAVEIDVSPAHLRSSIA